MEIVEDTEKTTGADREEPADAQIAPSSIIEKPISQPVLTASIPADDTSTAPLPKTPFNRYKHPSKRAMSEERRDETNTTEKAGNSVIEKEQGSGTTGISEEVEKGGQGDRSGSKGVRNGEDNSLAGVESGAETGNVETTQLGPGGEEEEQPSPKQDHAKPDEVATQDEGTERHSTGRELSGPGANPYYPLDKKASLQELNSEDVGTLAREIAEKEDLMLFTEQNSIQTIENSILPGTWMLNHITLSRLNFQKPQGSNAYLMIREISEDMPSENIVSFPKPVRQIILYRHMKDICDLMDSGDPIEAINISNPIFVLLFDNNYLNMDEKVVYGIHNFINRLLRFFIHKEYTNKSIEKKKIANIKHVLEALTSKVVQVAMPKPIIPSMNTAYTLANLHYLSDRRNIESILLKASSSDSTRKLEVKVHKGNKKASISTEIIRVHASNV